MCNQTEMWKEIAEYDQRAGKGYVCPRGIDPTTWKKKRAKTKKTRRKIRTPTTRKKSLVTSTKEKIVTVKVALPKSLYDIIRRQAATGAHKRSPAKFIADTLDHDFNPGAEA